MLDFTDKAFNKMSFSIKMPVIFSARLSVVATRRNDDFSARPPEALHKGFGIIAFVGNQAIKNKAFNQIIGLPMIALLTAGQNKAHGISQSINRQMNLSGKAAATSA